MQTRSLTSLPGVIVPSTSIPLQADAGVRCHTNHLILARSVGTRDNGPQGYSPQQVAGAYGVSLADGSGAIAIVDAYDYPNALDDFNFFSSTFALPTESSANATASTNTLFQVVYASGTKPLGPTGNPNSVAASWDQESAGDIQWAHALAPHAKVYLVEAASENLSDIMAAVKVARTLPGVREVSLSIGSLESQSGGCNYVDYDRYFVQPGVVFFAATGDTPAERDYPALSSNVVAVGATTLTIGSSNNWISEVVWNQTGCGPSAFEPRPQFQDAFYSTIGLYRAACDVVADGDPNTGVSVYDSVPYQGASGWFIAGGTSVSVPVMAAIANDSGIAFASSQAFNAFIYSHAGSSYFRRLTGSSGSYGAGGAWSFPAGLGSPNSLQTLLASDTSAVQR